MVNDIYKFVSDAYCRHREFKEGDYVMVRIFPERCPKNNVQKLHVRTIGTNPILRRLGSNAYLIELPSNMSINSIFNMVDLFSYRGTFKPPAMSSSISAGTSSTPFLVLLSLI